MLRFVRSIGALVLASSLSGCAATAMDGYASAPRPSGSASGGYRVGLPEGRDGGMPTGEEIQRKFQQDVEFVRRARAR